MEHKYIYYDERKDKLEKIEQSARRELGMLPQEGFDPESIRGKFVAPGSHLQKYRDGGPRVSFKTAVVIIALLVFVAHWIVNGKPF